MDHAREIKGEGFGGIIDEVIVEMMQPVNDSVSDNDAEENRPNLQVITAKAVSNYS
jgi:hypothetical protein